MNTYYTIQKISALTQDTDQLVDLRLYANSSAVPVPSGAVSDGTAPVVGEVVFLQRGLYL
jgi:hypothetical protein